jgi:hypothetical protein
MSVVIASSLVLSDVALAGGVINANNPIIGYQNLVTPGSLSTTTADPAYPAANMANPATYSRWKGLASAADQFIRMDLHTAELVDYVAIARHNFFSAQIPVSLEVLDAGSPESWSELVADFVPASDGPILMRFAPQAVTSLRLRLQPGAAAPTAAVLYAGPLLVIQRRLYVGHKPMPLNVVTRATNGRSESGNFLGRIVMNQTTRTEVNLQNLTPGWYRSVMAPFIAQARELPFFFAWRPGDYPDEVGYGWLTNDPVPENMRSNGMMRVSFQMNGIV